MAYKSLDFKSDKQIQYQELGVEMANLFVDDVYIRFVVFTVANCRTWQVGHGQSE